MQPRRSPGPLVCALCVAAGLAAQNPPPDPAAQNPPQNPAPQNPATPTPVTQDPAAKPGQQGPTAKQLQDRPNPVDAEADKRGAAIRSMTLGDAMRVGRVHNVGLRAAEVIPEQARLDLIFVEAGFEPELYGSTGYSDRQTPARNAFNPSVRSTTIDAEVGWRQRVVTGGLFDLAFQPARFESSGSSAFPDKQFSSEWVASYRQPLLRGAWTDYTLAPITAARYRVAQSNQDYERSVQDTLLTIVEAYWELAFARENWWVVVSALEVAEEQLRITDERIRVQALAPRDRVADEAEVARRQEELIAADNQIRAREDDLRRLLFDGTDRNVWRINLRTTSQIPVEPATEEIPFEPLIEVAMTNRPDLRSLRASVAVAEVAQLEAQRDVLPALDLVSAYSSDGVRDSFSDAFDDSIEQQFPDWSVRLEFAIPIGNHAARAREQRAKLEVERVRRILHGATLDVAKEVRAAVRNLYSLAQAVHASAESVRLATSNLETEQVKLRVGASTAFEVQRRNQELREAKSRHLRNQLGYRTAESRLLHAQGLLNTNIE